ncbi:hypothetical protein [Ramlibacter alkalitolerans]|uniref:Type 4 secretion system PilS N-terminal domain-containing protein n=1 Tax=Ramlibacter alkalitolerans TaxID=2039631 RepID=A0ABS1JU09_9BURK|nr:hypothetical protein [Ramlibacter alkalitolerans]MBL0427763.1 hypothetical protein [Ramlibacter alkalitolerans]
MLSYIFLALAALLTLGSLALSAPSYTRAPTMDATAVMVETQRAVTGLTSLVNDTQYFPAVSGRVNDFGTPATDTVWPLLNNMSGYGSSAVFPAPSVPGFGFALANSGTCGQSYAQGLTCSGSGYMLIVYITAANPDFTAAQSVLAKTCARMPSSCVAGAGGTTTLAKYGTQARSAALFRLSGTVAFP